MPVRERKLTRTGLPDEEALRAELRAELEGPHDRGEPEIIVERPNPATTHLFAIWAKWDDLEQMVRSRIILDAYREARGEAEALKVTVAMGLTPSEAERLGIE